VDRADGPATVAACTVVHGPGGTPEWGVAVCDLADAAGSRTYARIEDAGLLADAAGSEWTGRAVTLASHPSREGANLVVA
jgi:hypothetical protein